jgi:uncharacterized protein YlxW (UPF0749 family)
MKNWKASLTLGIVCMVLAMAICIQIKTVDNSNTTVSQTLTSNELRDQILKQKEKYDKSVVELENTEKKLEEMRVQATKNDDQALKIEEQIKLDNILLGLTDVKGSGIEIVLKDNDIVKRENIIGTDNLQFYIIHAGDLITVINDLKNAGAEAIEVNGQRIVNSSSIYCAGNVIKINGEKITSPITIKAIGEPDLLYGSMNILGGYIQLLRETGISVDIKKSNNIEIGKYEGVIKPQFMQAE